ncbi:unnamed protein product [Caenorhabditis auriculariae]|uniref:Uncharacterized protein n=1 Tax=Caenorhabditis auriculariae TaxID=2777116 RepID=A0A8S1GU74_9PELO|nr:unnamed protein product [Caenorhabditis auriculariae]
MVLSKPTTLTKVALHPESNFRCTRSSTNFNYHSAIFPLLLAAVAADYRRIAIGLRARFLFSSAGALKDHIRPHITFSTDICGSFHNRIWNQETLMNCEIEWHSALLLTIEVFYCFADFLGVFAVLIIDRRYLPSDRYSCLSFQVVHASIFEISLGFVFHIFLSCYQELTQANRIISFVCYVLLTNFMYALLVCLPLFILFLNENIFRIPMILGTEPQVYLFVAKCSHVLFYTSKYVVFYINYKQAKLHRVHTEEITTRNVSDTKF